MNPLALAIKGVIEAQGLTYLRTININDLNEQVGETDLSGGVGIYTSTPQIENLQFIGGGVVSNHTIEVYYLQLNDTVDDKGEAIDVILDALKPFADGFYDLIRKDPIVSLTIEVEGYELDSVESLKMSKEVLTGWRLRMVLPIDRKAFSCKTEGSYTSIVPDFENKVRLVGSTNVASFSVNDVVFVKSDDLVYNESYTIGSIVSDLITMVEKNPLSAGPGTYSKTSNA